MLFSPYRIAAIVALAIPAVLPSRHAVAAASRDTPFRESAIQHEKEHAWLAAAHDWASVLERIPDDTDALRHRVLALGRGGAPYLAQQLAAQQAQLFTTEEHYQLAHTTAALTLSFGAAHQAWHADAGRFAMTDLALQEQQRVLDRFGPRNGSRLDQLLGLRIRGDMRGAVRLYETLRAENREVLPYARAAAGEAYLALHQPEQARDLLQTVVSQDGQRGETIDAEIALAYAYMEAEQPGQAIALIDRLLEATPLLMHRGLAGVEQPNPDYARLAVQAALLRLYSNRPEQAETRLRQLREQAPFNTDVRLAWAGLQAMREHRRLALEEFQLMQVDYPDSIDAAVGSGETLLALHQWPQARAALAALQTDDPTRHAVQTFAREVRLQQQPLIHSELLIGRGAAAAGAESLLDILVQSAPLSDLAAQDLRITGHLARSRGTLAAAGATNPRTSQVRNRGGAGLRYRDGVLGIDGELNHADGVAASNGAVLTTVVTPSDHWLFSAVIDSNLNTLPAAAYQAGTTARQQLASASWSANESCKAGLEASEINFSDGNRRHAAHLWWNQRWVSAPGLTLETTLTLAQSRNRTLATPYFNPQQEHEFGLAGKVEWLTWRRYQHQLRQRLNLQLGRYRQSDSSAGAAADAHYEIDWQVDDALALVLGAGHAFHPYDGAREQRSYGYLNLNWIIQ